MRRGKPVPHYDRNFGVSKSVEGQSDSVLDDDEDAMDEAAQALREAEVEAVRPNPVAVDQPQLANMSIDELRALAAKLDVPNLGAITEQEHLIAAIRMRI
jgi:hypothetical protein